MENSFTFESSKENIAKMSLGNHTFNNCSSLSSLMLTIVTEGLGIYTGIFVFSP